MPACVRTMSSFNGTKYFLYITYPGFSAAEIYLSSSAGALFHRLRLRVRFTIFFLHSSGRAVNTDGTCGRPREDVSQVLQNGINISVGELLLERVLQH